MQLVDSKGFTLAEFLLSLGITGIISLFAMNYVQQESSNEAITKYRTEVSQSVSSLQYSLNDRKMCEGMLKGKLITPEGVELTGGLRVKPEGGGEDIVLLEPKDYPKFSVQSILLKSSTLSPTTFELAITYAPKAPSMGLPLFSFKKAALTKTLTIVGSTDAEKRIVSCSSLVSDTNLLAKESFCENLNLVPNTAIWDPTARTCKLNMENFLCEGTMIPIALAKIGQFRCGEASFQLDYDRMFDFQVYPCPAKRYAIYLRSDGKISIGCPTESEKVGPRPLLE